MLLVGIDVPAEDIQAQVPDEIQLRATVRDFRRQQAVVLMVRKPLPVIRRIDDARRGFASEHGFHAFAVAGDSRPTSDSLS